MSRRIQLFASVVVIGFIFANGGSRLAHAQVRAEESELRGRVARVRTDEIRDGRIVATVIEQYDRRGEVNERTVSGSEGATTSAARFGAVVYGAPIEGSGASTVIRERREVPEVIDLTHRLRFDPIGRLVARDSYGPAGDWLSTVSYRYARGGRIVGLTTWTPAGDLIVEIRTFASDGGLLSRSTESRGGLARELCTDSLDGQGNWVKRDVTRIAGGETEHFRLVRQIKYEEGERNSPLQ